MRWILELFDETTDIDESTFDEDTGTAVAAYNNDRTGGTEVTVTETEGNGTEDTVTETEGNGTENTDGTGDTSTVVTALGKLTEQEALKKQETLS